MDKKLRAEMAKRHNATGLYRRLPFQYTYKSRLPRKKGLVKRCMLRILKKVQFKKTNQVKKRSKEPNTRPSTPERETMSESEADAMPVEAKPEESEANSEESEAEANPEESEANPEESEAESNPEESEAEANPVESEKSKTEEFKPGGLMSILKKVEPMQEEEQEQEPEPEEEPEQDPELEPISAPRKPFPNLRGIEFLRKSRWSLEYDCE